MTAHQDKASDHQPQLEDSSSSAGDNEIINVVGSTPPGRRMGGMPK